MQVDYGLDKQGRVVSFSYNGVVTINDIQKQWSEALDQKLIQNQVLGFIVDCRNAILNFHVDETINLSNFFKKNICYFMNKRFAYITQSPEQVVFPILLQEEATDYEARPFSTPEAALLWILN